MSQEAVEVVRLSTEPHNGEDMVPIIREVVDGLDWSDTDSVVAAIADDPKFQRLRTAFDTDSVELVGDFVDAGDRALVRFVWHTAGRGLRSHLEVTHVATVRDGRIVLNEYFWEHSDALKAVGLED